MTDQNLEELEDRINQARSWLIEARVALEKENKLKPLKEAKTAIEKAIKLIE